MKILITGITGFVGPHLAEYCLTLPETEIFGTVFSGGVDKESQKIDELKKRVELLECDLTEKASALEILEKTRPDKIFHLAAQSFVPLSWKSPQDTIVNNIVSELNIFEAIRALAIAPIIIIACSSEEYGLVSENELPVKEENPLRPLSPYAVSKVAQEMLGYQYSKSYGLKAVLTRFFNTEGPGRGEEFVCSNFAKQIVEIEKGKKEPVIFVGNLEAKRDFSDVRDMVRAYWLASEKCRFGEPYNICSGQPKSVQSVLDLLLSLSKAKNIQIKQDPARMRSSEVSSLFGDSSKFREETGWRPEIPFEKTMEDLLNYWRERI